MSTSLHTVSIVSSFLPQDLIEALQETPQSPTGEIRAPQLKTLNDRAHRVALLIANIILNTIKALQENDFEALDGRPGDLGCQNRAFELRRLKVLGLPKKEELGELKTKAESIEKLVKERKSNAKDAGKRLPSVFFENEVATLRFSKELEFMMHCYLSRKLAIPDKVLSSGIVVTKSDPDQLSKLSDQIELKREILKNNQSKLSFLSVEATHSAVTDDALTRAMLSSEQAVLYTENPRYEPKTFGCHFYEIKLLLETLKRKKGIVCIKQIVPKGQESFSLFLRSPNETDEFQLITKEDFGSSDPIVVFEVVAEKEPLVALLENHGFTDTVLSQIAKEAPITPTSTLNDIKNPDAQTEISFYAEIGKTIQSITIDHVYLTLKKGSL